MLRRTRAFLHRLTGKGGERRIHPRYKLDVETVCRALADDSEMPARIRNVSRSGICIVVPHSVPVGTMIRINLPVSVKSAQTTMLACVTNVNELPEQLWSLGCVFSLELSDAEMRQFGGEKTPSKPDDQRAWVRCPVRGEITYRLLAVESAPPRSAELVDLAPAGVGLVVGEKLEAGAAIMLDLPRQQDKPAHSLLACVVYVADRPDARWTIGCHFLRELSEKELSEMVWRTPS